MDVPQTQQNSTIYLALHQRFRPDWHPVCSAFSVMRVLVSGDAGPVVSGTIAELLRRGHSVRLRSPNAADEARRWNRVEPFDAIGGSAGGCDAIIHIGPGDADAMLAEAERESGFRRFAYVIASHAADPLSLDDSRIGWTVIRHSPVYGPGDELVSPVLKIVRSLPVVPVVERGEQRVRPIWYEDLARAVVALVERRDTARRTFAIAGSEWITVNELVDRLRKITARKPLRVPVPRALERIAASFPDDTLASPMRLREFGVNETTLDRGLRILADALPEQFLDEGVGRVHHKRFHAGIRGSRHSTASLMAIFRDRVNEIIPIEFVAEPGAAARIERGAAMTMSLPGRGHVQVRVERCDPTDIVFATLEGHPIAGMVEFTTRDLPGGVIRFAVDNYSRGGNLLDTLALRTAGEPAQSANWRKVVENMIEASGGTSDGVSVESHVLDDDAAALVERRLRELVEKRQRDESASPERPA